MPWNEFLLPILAGYVFISLFNITKFRAQRHDSYRLLIESLIFGVGIFAVARLLAIWVHTSYKAAYWEEWLRQHNILYSFAGTGAIAVIIAYTLAKIGNLIISADKAKRLLIDEHANGLLRLFHKAAFEARMVSVTLSSRKVYIGYVVRTPSLTPEEQFVGILPVVSGYRDKDTLRMEITTNYGPVISSGATSAHDFEVTFALASIDSASLFDPAAYPLFDAPPSEKHPPPALLPGGTS